MQRPRTRTLAELRSFAFILDIPSINYILWAKGEQLFCVIGEPKLTVDQARGICHEQSNRDFGLLEERKEGMMGYIENNLVQGERITHRTRLHWVIFLLPLLAIALIGLPAREEAPAILLLCVIWLIVKAITYVTAEFAITDKRVIMKKGWIRIDSLEILLSKVESLGVTQSVLGRILNYGTVSVHGTGGIMSQFKGISKPMEFRRKVQESLPMPQP